MLIKRRNKLRAKIVFSKKIAMRFHKRSYYDTFQEEVNNLDFKDKEKEAFDSTKIAFAVINTITRVLIICAYAVLFYKFNRLIKQEQNENFLSMKCQVVTFFTIALVAMSMRLFTGIY
jgi:hypothetical protein